jgi:hypothetical protein
MIQKVYLISALDKNVIIDTDEIVYKIGVTRQIKDKRTKQLSTGNSKNLKIVKEFKSEYAYKLETALHNTFRNKKINKEWYMLSKDEVDNFITLCEKYENNYKILKEFSTLNI